MLKTRNLSLNLSGRPVLQDVTVDIPEGKVTVIIGPNGCGKSTLLRTLARIARPDRGEVRLSGTDLWQIPPRRFAQAVAFMPQHPVAPEGLRVRGLLERGRTPHLGPFRPMTPNDDRAVDYALDAAGLRDLAERRVDRLSGGQRQRAWIAMAVAQDTPVLMLDEPTSFLDLPHQIEVMKMVQRLNAEAERTVVMVIHDINQAAAYADQIIAMRAGRVEFAGAPRDVMTPDALGALFDLPLRQVPDGERPAIIMPDHADQ